MIELKDIIYIEIKRVLHLKSFLLFIAVVLFFSITSSYIAVKNYDIPDHTGVAVSWSENISHARENSRGQYMGEEYLSSLKVSNEAFDYLDRANANELVAINYIGKAIQDLTEEEIKAFYPHRLSNIQETLNENSRITYTEKEKEQIMEQAGQLSSLPMDYAEGWKHLNKDMGIFTAMLLILISLLLLPMFGRDSQTKMEELSRSTMYGKRNLDRSRLLAALIISIVLYLSGTIVYFLVKMIPLGFDGDNLFIQSNPTTFFSVYNITYIQQFLINIGVGMLAMLFMISLTLLLTVLTNGVLTSAAGIAFFWILLQIFEQVPLYPVNHYFANFMPLRMTAFQHYYIGNEIYRILGNSLTSLQWVTVLSAAISTGTILLTIFLSNIKLRKVIR